MKKFLNKVSSEIVVFAIRHLTTKDYRRTVEFALNVGVDVLERLEIERAKGNRGEVNICIPFNALKEKEDTVVR